MIITALAFYAFAAVLIGSAVMVVTSRNPVHSVLFLILAFFNAAALFLIAGAEFLAMILVIVYVGAVAVLFLFVVMMLDIDFEQLRGGFQKYAPVAGAIGLVLFAELLLAYGAWGTDPQAEGLRMYPMPEGVTNAQALGRILYTDNLFLFQSAGLILLVAMIGAIVLTHRSRPETKRQNIADQVARSGSVSLRQVGLRQGIKEIGIERPPLPEAPKPKKALAHHGDDHGAHGGGHH
jgi:NADH-quinone oxidoreductase subunit J